MDRPPGGGTGPAECPQAGPRNDEIRFPGWGCVGLLDFLADWNITTLILAALAISVVVLVGSYGMALGWRRWKDAKRRRRTAQRRAAGGQEHREEAPDAAPRRRGLAAMPKLKLRRKT